MTKGESLLQIVFEGRMDDRKTWVLWCWTGCKTNSFIMYPWKTKKNSIIGRMDL